MGMGGWIPHASLCSVDGIRMRDVQNCSVLLRKIQSIKKRQNVCGWCLQNMLNSKAFPVFTDIPGVWWHIHEEHCCERGQGWRTELPGCLPVVYVCQWPGVLGCCKRGLSRYPGHLWKFLTSTPLEKFAFQQAENGALVTCEMWPRSNVAVWFQLDTYWLVLHAAGV